MSNLDFEKELWDSNYKYICGIDEVGRGCLAGPVYSGATILKNTDELNTDIFSEINDSKKISENKREKLYDYIKKIAYISVGICSVEEIDEIGIQNAVKLSMVRAINNLEIKPEYLLIDSMALDIDIPQKSIIKGDQKSKSISAASIVAKVERDNLMKLEYAKNFPDYNFEKNKGYGTKKHIEAINEFGITNIHRKTFEPIKSMIEI
ncbi:MAG: ribonuclease HII [Chloroflexi bacterium]|nr:ribonuclease HII [Chloroflexota bacterium]|tara:strand:+ start:1175 stop:1795 length:621 start_codon:yes stop_codon:yes gene_type:complete